MKRIPIFQLSNSTLITKNFALDIQINGDNIQPKIEEAQVTNETIAPTTTTTTTTTAQVGPSQPPVVNSNVLNINNKFEHRCNTCLITFNDKDSRNEHYRSVLHRYNLKLKLSHLPVVSQAEYESLVNNLKKELTDHGEEEDSEDSEDSSSEDEASHDESYLQQGYQFSDTAVEINDPKVKIISKELKIQVSVWKCILSTTAAFKELMQHRNDSEYQASKGHELIKQFKSIVSSGTKLKWAVLLCSGGRFAGSVNQIGSCLEHKAFHRYTTRKKQGGSQSSKDQQGGTKHSGGASLRRYNEKRLKEDVEELLRSWKPHLDECAYIFIFAPKGNTRDTLFPPNGTTVSANDERIRSIPFPILRPTFSETQRVSSTLFSVDIELFDEEKELIKQKEAMEKREHEEREMMKIQKARTAKEDAEREKREKQERYTKDPLFEAVRAGDMERVKHLIEVDESYELPEPSEGDSLVSPLFLAVESKNLKMAEYLAQVFPHDIDLCIPEVQFKTVLMRAAEQGSVEMIEMLLNSGANPCVVGDLNKQTAYDLSATQKARDAFREWAGDHLDRWDYNIAHIPPLTAQMKKEKEEKKKLKRKAQKEKDKVKKQTEKEKEKLRLDKEVEEKLKLDELNLIDKLTRDKVVQESKLTDREKRALAAEARLSGSKKCNHCNKPIPGVPFERLTYIYCSTKCVVDHKKILNI